MGIKFGEIDSGQILENEFRIGVLEKLIELILSKNPALIQPSPQEIVSIKKSVVEILQKKYPNSGIKLQE